MFRVDQERFIRLIFGLRRRPMLSMLFCVADQNEAAERISSECEELNHMLQVLKCIFAHTRVFLCTGAQKNKIPAVKYLK